MIARASGVESGLGLGVRKVRRAAVGGGCGGGEVCRLVVASGLA